MRVSVRDCVRLTCVNGVVEPLTHAMHSSSALPTFFWVESAGPGACFLLPVPIRRWYFPFLYSIMKSAPAKTMERFMSDSADSPGKDELKQALKAFKKRLKLTRLDEESRIGRNPVTTGKASGIVAITPPNQFRPAVWDELVRLGKLKPAGRGTFELVSEE